MTLRTLSWLKEGLISALFPPSCAACGALDSEPFCAICAQQNEWAPRFSLPEVEQVWAAFRYEGPVREAIHALKYGARPELGLRLGRAMARRLPFVGEVIVPVPIAGHALGARGYNQARELARGLCGCVRPRALMRRNRHQEQVGLDREARRRNIAGAFAAGPAAASVRGLDVLLVDDVITTGATIEACTRVLKEAGAKGVRAAALAYTVSGF
ncbi:MAG: ComF family protein [Deltaproteobacteria bacterium]|nr:ComF family protein [Deltaproteobacteria bacterium]